MCNVRPAAVLATDEWRTDAYWPSAADASSLVLAGAGYTYIFLGVSFHQAPATPPSGSFRAPSTPRPPWVRERPSFLHPNVCFLEAVSDRRLVVISREILGVKQEIANMWRTTPRNVFMADRHCAYIVDEMWNNFAAEVTVYVHRPAA